MTERSQDARGTETMNETGNLQQLEYSEVNLTARDSTSLFVRHYRPSGGPAKHPRHLVIIHGASEHGGHYDHVARAFVDRSWNVLVADQRGHGHSGGIRTHVRNHCLYLQDMDIIWRHFDLLPERTALLGHSFGGLISIRYAQTRPGNLSALVLMSPLLRLKVVIDPFTLISGKILSYVAPRFRFQSRIDLSMTTRNQESLAQRVQDPAYPS